MKKITTLLFILLAMPIYAQWVPQNSGVTVGLNDVYCITEDIVVVVGESGTILKTLDGGENWIQKTSGTTYNLHKVQFPSPNVGYAIGSMNTGNKILIKTIDGGENWTSIDLEGTSSILDISCVNENIFYITCNDGLKKTINGGNTFEIVNTNQYSDNIQFISDQIGYTGNMQVDSAGSDNLRKTTDGGNTWSVITSNNLISFFFLNENIGFINTTDGLYKTIDGGESYIYLQTITSSLHKLFATSENVVWGIPLNVC
jgi:photosystem II stability/assembly factor-like uncharacterized protein